VYIPRHFAVEDLDQIAGFVDAVGAADLVTFDGARPVATLLPVSWERSGEGHGRLLGHMAVANPQWSTASDEALALAIVHGPQAYVSPSWYPSRAKDGRVVPTWNYTAVHFTGRVTFHQDPQWLRDVVTRLTERYEHDRPQRWWVADAPSAYIDGQLRGIVGVEMYIVTVEAKNKLSQNRSAADQASVIAGLRGEGTAEAAAVADLMDHGAAGSAG